MSNLFTNRTNVRQFENRQIEYRELHQWLRHIEVAWWAFGAVLISVTALFFSKNTGHLFLDGNTVVMAIPLMVAWVLYMVYTKHTLHRSLILIDQLRKLQGDTGLEAINGNSNKLDLKKMDDVYDAIAPTETHVLSTVRPILKCLPDSLWLHQMVSLIFLMVLSWWVVSVIYIAWVKRDEWILFLKSLQICG